MARRSPIGILWSNILIRTAVYYAVLGTLLYLFRDNFEGGVPAGDELANLVSKKAAKSALPASGPAALPTAIAMVSAVLFALPVSWIYTLTRRKKGWKQGIVQSLVILPAIIAGIVVVLKYGLALAFGMAAIVAAVRFRSTLDDTKDAAYMLVAIGVGLSAGVNPQVAGVLSFIFSVVMVAMWFTDFGRTPAALEGRFAEKQLERALETASRTGTFVARMDDEVFKALAPEQLEAIADRAWRRRKRNAPELTEAESGERPQYAVLLRLRTAAPDELRTAVEPHFEHLFARWRFGDIVHEDDGMHVVEYAVDFDPTVTPGVVSDKLRDAAGPRLVRLEMR
ncbi:MAG TPA: DUF4956 domain-containing protein [Gemmatimonadaceae bacterium]|nr:DUF4956 domain-containing protein [Gemmatimonadaceae bacterium]